MPILQQVDLWNNQAGHDKTYHIALCQDVTGGFSVRTKYGQRRATEHGRATSGFKGPFTNQRQAETIYTRTVNSKLAGGYVAHNHPINMFAEYGDRPGTPGPQPPWMPVQGAKSKFLPQLCNPINEDQAENYISSDAWGMQEKKDGERLMLRFSSNGMTGTVVAYNRRGVETGVATTVMKDLSTSNSKQFFIDGEAITGEYHVFDILELNEEDLTTTPYIDRYIKLVNLIEKSNFKHIKVVPFLVSERGKKSAFAKFKEEGREGVVFRQKEMQYSPGRPNSNGPLIKCKFWNTASVIVAGINGAAMSIRIEAINSDNHRVLVGNVTIPINREIPAPGTVIEVRYLYFTGIALFQPTYLGIRRDINPEECTFTQFRLKPEEEDA